MAGRSEHGRIDKKRPIHSVYERLHPEKVDAPSGGHAVQKSPHADTPEERDALFACLFQVSSDGIVFHEWSDAPREGRIVDVNDQMCRILGYTRSEILKLPMFEVLDEEVKRTLPELRQRLGQLGPMQLETTLVAKGGQPVPVEVHVNALSLPQRNMTLSVVRDVTERRRLQEQERTQTRTLKNTVDQLQAEMTRRMQAEGTLRRQSRMLEAFFQNTITPLAFLDRHFHFVRVNEAYARAAGKSPDYFVGQSHFALYPDEENQAIFEQVVQSRQVHQAYAQPFTYPDQPQRGVMYWDWRLTPLCDEAGAVQFLVLSLDDVTDRQKAMQESQRRARQLRKVTLELSEAEERERRRLAEILHDDLQQTLAAAKFHLGLLHCRVRDDEVLRGIVADVNQMLKDTIEKSRSLSHELGPAVLSQSRLEDAFEWLARQMETQHGLIVHIQTRGRIDSPSEPVRLFLYRAAREILFNVVKHAQENEGCQEGQECLVRCHCRILSLSMPTGFAEHPGAAASNIHGLLSRSPTKGRRRPAGNGFPQRSAQRLTPLSGGIAKAGLRP